MKMHKTVIFMLYISVLQISQYVCARCAHYYTILEMEPPGFITIKTLNEVLSMGYPYNISDEYNIIKNNINCVLELNCDDSTSAECTAPIKVVSRKSKHEFIPSVGAKHDKTEAPSELTTVNNATIIPPIPPEIEVAPTTVNAEILGAPEKITTEPPTVDSEDAAEIPTKVPEINISVTPAIDPEKDNTMTPEDTTPKIPMIITTTEIMYPNNSISTTHPVTFETTTLEHNINDAAFLTEEEKKKKIKERVQTAALVVGSLAGGALLVLLARHILEAVQSGTYRFPDPTAANTAV